MPGPLEPYVPGFRDELARRGYALWSATSYLGLMGCLSRWLRDHGLALAELSPQVVERFLEERRARGYAKGRSVGGMLGVLTAYLRGQGAIPDLAAATEDTPLERLLAEFAAYLAEERGLAERTIVWYRHVARLFLGAGQGLGDSAGDRRTRLTASGVSAFVLGESTRRGTGSCANVAVALRAFMRFLYVRGHTTTPLAGAVPKTPCWRGGGISRALGEDQVARLLASCGRRTAAGRRDFAILTVLARLGLRAKEVAALAIDDVDWRGGEIRVAGKGNRLDRLPLPIDVGEALADDCRWARPRGDCRALFLHVRSPHAALSSTAVSHAVVRACGRGGLPRAGAHRLRHSAATAMRRAGAPLFEIGQILRHRHAVTTALYAKDDAEALAAVARRRPGSAA